MKKLSSVTRSAIVCLTLCIVLTGFSLPAVFGQQSVFADPLTSGIGQELRLIKSDEESIVLELYASAYQVSEMRIGEMSCHSLSTEGHGETSEVGRPQLPVKGVMLGVPAEAKVEVRVLEADFTLVAERYNVCPVPNVVVREDPYDIKTLKQPFGFGPADIEYVFTKDGGVYSTDKFYPDDLVQVASSGYLRDQRFVQLQLHPLQYNPVSQQLRFHKRMKVELRFTYGGKATPMAGTGEIGGPFEGVMRDSLLNYELAKGWRSRAALRSVSIQGKNPPASQLSWRIAVNEDGIYKLSYADLSTEGFPSGVISSTLKLFNEGSEVAIYVDDPEESFGSGDYILFYGQKMNTKYTDTNVYWLTQGETAGLRMPQKDGTLSGTKTVPASFYTHKKAEEELSYQSWLPGGDELDRWAWNYVLAPSIPSQTYPLALSTIVTDSYTSTLRVSLYGFTDGDHHTKLYVNDQLVEDTTWEGSVGRISQVSFRQSYLLEGDNTVKVECLKTSGKPYDLVYVDWVEVSFHDAYIAENNQLRFSGDQAETWEYPWEYHIDGFTTSDIEVFDITDPVTPTHIISTTVESTSIYTHTLKFEDTITDSREYLALTTAQRLSPLSIKQDTFSDLRSTSNGADYIIITHSDFAVDLPGERDDIYDLESHRQSQGLRTMVVDVQDVYDEFSYGVLDARAIRDFLAYAYQNWVPSPSYVLLVGDGNYDCKNNLGSSPPNYIPPYLAFVDTGSGGIGETATDNRYVTVSGNDVVPDMHIGRLPVSSSAEVSAVINKILDYEQDPPGGNWNQKALFVADNIPDGSGDFVALSNDIVDNYLPGPYMDDKVYLNDYCGPPSYTHCPAATDAITEAISDGRLLVNYFGHGGVFAWAHETVFRTDATRNDVDSLTTGHELPMMLSMACVTGYFHHPSGPCLNESLLGAEGKGAIATWSATGFGMALGDLYLEKGFFTAVFTDTISEIGTATYLGKLNLYNSTTGYRDLMDTYVLFGDPFMKLNLPACDAADFDKDRQITVVDITQVAIRWASEWGDEDYDRKYDLDNDGEITVVDIMKVAAQWGKTCGTP